MRVAALSQHPEKKERTAVGSLIQKIIETTNKRSKIDVADKES